MSVYMMAAKGYMKVGYSNNPFIRSLAVTHSGRLPEGVERFSRVELLGWFPGDRRNELLAHAALNDHWVIGEWYRDVPEVRAYLHEQPNTLIIAEVSARAMLAVFYGATVADAKREFPMGDLDLEAAS